MRYSEKRRRAEKRARAQLQALIEARGMLIQGKVRTSFSNKNTITLNQIDKEILELKKKLLIIR